MRLISFSLTTRQFLAGAKTVTRRLGWFHTKEVEATAKNKTPGNPEARCRPSVLNP